MSENQVIALRNALETYLGGEKLKVAEKDKNVAIIQETHRTTIYKIKNEMFDEILDLATLSKYIFKAAYQEICEIVLKLEKKAIKGSTSETRIKNGLYNVSIEHLKICSENEIDNNQVPWVVYILQLLKKPYILSNIHMENEISYCLYSCAANSQLYWVQHALLRNLWSTIWRRIQNPELDPTVLGNYTKTIIELLENVKLDVFELTGYGLAKLAISSLKKSIDGRTERNFWTTSRKSAYIQILSTLLKTHALHSLDFLLFELPAKNLAEHFVSQLSIFEHSPTLQFFDDFFRCFQLLPAEKCRENGRKMKNLAAECAAFMLAGAENALTIRGEPPEKCCEFLARVLVVGECWDEIEKLRQTCTQRSLSLRILTQILKSRPSALKNRQNLLDEVWKNREQFQSDAMRCAMCQLFSANFPAFKNFGGAAAKIASVLKYALSLITNQSTLADAANLVETIFRYSTPRNHVAVPRDLLPRVIDTLMTRGSPNSPPIQKAVSAFLAHVDFEENWHLASFFEMRDEEEEETQRKRERWRFRKSIIDWLLTSTNSLTPKILRQICKFQPQMCNFDEFQPCHVDPLKIQMQNLKLLKIPEPEEHLEDGKMIEELVASLPRGILLETTENENFEEVLKMPIAELEKLKMSEKFSRKILEKCIFENEDDVYDVALRFEKFAMVLTQDALREAKEKIFRLTSDVLSTKSSIEESDAFLIQTITLNTCLKFQKNVKFSGNLPLDPYFVAEFPENVDFSRETSLKYLRKLRNSPWFAQNIVRNLVENEPRYRGFLAPILSHVLAPKNENLLMVCVAKIANFREVLRFFQVNFDTKQMRKLPFLKFENEEKLKKCQNYLKLPKNVELDVEDYRLLMGTCKLSRIAFQFWRIFRANPGEILEVLVEFVDSCERLGFHQRLKTVLETIWSSEFAQKSSQIVKFVMVRILSRNPGENSNSASKLVENFVKNGLDERLMENLEIFADPRFYAELHRFLREEKGNSQPENQKIFEILSQIWRYLPELRSAIQPIVAQFFAHKNFPQPATRFDAENLAETLRFKLALRIMSRGNGAKLRKFELTTMCVMFLEDWKELAYFQVTCANLGKHGAFGKLCREIGGELKDEKMRILARIGQVFPEIAMMTIPQLLHSHLSDHPNSRESLVARFLKIARFCDKSNRDCVECLAECVDSIGLDVFAGFEDLEEDRAGIEIFRFFELAMVFLKYRFLDHSFFIANLIFDRISYKNRNLMMIQRISIADFKSENAEKLLELLRNIYCAENNAISLATLPSDESWETRKIALASANFSLKKLKIFSESERKSRDSTICEWMCGMRETAANSESQKYLAAILRANFENECYPKHVDCVEKEIYRILYHLEGPRPGPSPLSLDFEEFRLVQVALGLFPPQNILEHVIATIRKIREKCGENGEILRVAKMLAELEAFDAALMILDKWKEQCVENPVDQSLIEICRAEILFNSGEPKIAEKHILSIKPQNFESRAEFSLVQSRILIEYRNDSEEAMRILEKSIKTSETRDSCAENQNSEVKLKVLLRFHDVCMDQLTELDKYKEGLIYRIKKQAIEQFQTQIDQKSEITRRKSSATRQIADDEENRRTIHRLTREQKCEQDHVDQTEAAIVAAAQKAVASGLAALETIATASRDAEDDATQRSQAALVIFPLIDVIFKYEVLPEIVAVVRDRTPRISSRLWICAASHVASRCFAARQQSPLRKYLRQILTRLVIDYPFHVLHTLLMYEYESNGAETRRFIDQIADECGSGGGDARKLRDIIREMRRAHEAYREFARIDARKDLAPAVNSRYTLPASLKLHHVELTRLPLPCVTQKLPRSACDYSARELVTWQTWKPYFTLADGLSTPKIWEIQGSDGFWYKIVWKKEDVRQDLLVEQMFDITNCILDKNDGLKNLRTYKIVPLDQGCGLIEFCHGTVSMKELLCGANRQGGLHHKYHPNECSISEITRQMRDCQKDSIEQRRQVFINICRQISPVFRHHFYESNHFSCQIWRQKLTEYRRSLSTWSVVGYIVGLGDRHTSNILFDMQQCHFVHIDFGMILEYSKRLLPVPELVPFRLTRDLLDPILIEGIENGQLAENCTNVLEKLKTHQKVLLGVASGLLRETMSNFREVEENLNRPSFISQMAIGRLREKLARKQISNLEIRRLLRESTNSDNLSRMFCGWMPFL